MPNGASAVINKPHPWSQLSRGRVKVFRDLLIRTGLEPAAPEEGDEEEIGHGDVEL
jgi:hypothetical protein